MSSKTHETKTQFMHNTINNSYLVFNKQKFIKIFFPLDRLLIQLRIPTIFYNY